MPRVIRDNGNGEFAVKKWAMYAGVVMVILAVGGCLFTWGYSYAGTVGDVETIKADLKEQATEAGTRFDGIEDRLDGLEDNQILIGERLGVDLRRGR